MTSNPSMAKLMAAVATLTNEGAPCVPANQPMESVGQAARRARADMVLAALVKRYPRKASRVGPAFQAARRHAIAVHRLAEVRDPSTLAGLVALGMETIQALGDSLEVDPAAIVDMCLAVARLESLGRKRTPQTVSIAFAPSTTRET